MVESSSSSKPQPDSVIDESVDPDKLNMPEGELEGADEEGVESDEYDVVDDEEQEEDSDDDEEDENEEEDAEEGSTLTHLLLGNRNKQTLSGENVNNLDDVNDEDEDDDYAFVPGGGIEPAEEELDGYARDPAPVNTIVSSGKRARDEDEDAVTAINGDAKRAKA